MKCVIVDDEGSFSEYFRKLLQEYMRELQISVSIEIAANIDEVLSLKDNYDFYFIHMEMKQADGFEVIKKLRSCYIDAEIIIVSVYDQNMQPAFFMKPCAYIRKGNLKEDTKTTVEYMQGIMNQRKNFLTLQYGKKTVEVFPMDLMYCYSEEHYVYFVYKEIKKEMYRMKLDYVAEMLQPFHFIRIHKRYIVNINCVQKLLKNDIYLADEIKVPISRQRKKYVEIVLKNWRHINDNT